MEIKRMENYGQRKQKAWITMTLIVLNILYFVYLEAAGSSEDVLFMLEHGAMFGPLVLEGHEYYRLLTAVFMHFGINHIVNNMLVLFVLGDNLERALGKIKYLFFYLSCGVGANAVSMLFDMGHQTHAVSAGASGSIFGVIGGLLYAVLVNRGKLEDLRSSQLIIMIIFSLYFGFTSTGVDNVAHVAGLVIGIVLAMLLYQKPKMQSASEYWEI